MVVHAVVADSFAARLGIEPGDIVVELGGAAVFGLRELVFFRRVFAAGQAADVAWVHDGELMRGREVLDEWQVRNGSADTEGEPVNNKEEEEEFE